MKDEHSHALIMKARDGDLDAFEEFVRINSKRIYGIAYQVVGNSDDAHDIAQEVFVRLHSGIHKYNPQFLFSTWLYRLAVNMSIDYMRRNARHKNASIDDPGVLRHPDSAPYPDEAYEYTEMHGAISKISSRLPDMQRKVFVLRDLQGFSCEEVARILGCRSSTVRVHLARARLRIRDKMIEEYPEFMNANKPQERK